ncbi:MAG: hypothetical protein SGJ17_00020 [Hyphomicrobiales bacterium]|nr:hypothetical protein [Hyphomicrobiales bacterium]
MRFVTLLAFGVWAGLAFLIYDMKYDSQRLQARAGSLAKSIEEEQQNLAVARAEWSHVTRPEHVEKLARTVLKFEPVKPEQMVRGNQPPAQIAGKSRAPQTTSSTGSDGIAALIERSVKKSGLGSHDIPR